MKIAYLSLLLLLLIAPLAGGADSLAEKERQADGHPWMQMIRTDVNGFFSVFRVKIDDRLRQLKALDRASVSAEDLARLEEVARLAKAAATEDARYRLMRTVHMETLVLGHTGEGKNDGSWHTYLSDQLEQRRKK